MSTDFKLANSAWEALFRAQATLVREFQLLVSWSDVLPREYGVLHALSVAPNGLRVMELGDDALLTQAGISRLVSRLHERGLVDRQNDPADARVSRIVLTAAGRAVQRRVGAELFRHVGEAMSRALDDDQLETLRDLTQALLNAAERARQSEGGTSDIGAENAP
ncbi:MarR family winged helix-turn-helix transcriptional regulator [Glaciibacter superstes]|uniref:MarR family winged helix-turn-helix transcriptional regulator n=1 Tax=Glaciibacter superstes TaxID=501023 RepID=UPI0003B6C575|nr:MarR family winged helix-turn-helix transcriptional regulator [Glaciibacter superstes]